MDKMKTNLLTLSAVLMGYEACLRGVRHPPVSDVQAVIFLGQRSILFLISTCKLQKQNKVVLGLNRKWTGMIRSNSAGLPYS